MACLLALDQGTTSSRAIVFDSGGDTLSSASQTFAQVYPRPGWVEHDPFELLRTQLIAAARALEGGIKPSAIGLANQRETTIVWDRATGQPVANAVVWQCRRTAPQCERLERAGLAGLIRSKTGLEIDPYFSATKIAWLLDNIDGARRRAEAGELLFGTVDSWLLWHLTAGTVHATDYTNAARTMLFNLDTLCWDEQLCGILGVPMAILPEVRPSGCFFGEAAGGLDFLGDAIKGVPIFGVAGDQQAALFGQACFAPGQVKCTYGTGCFLMMNTGARRVTSNQKLLTTIAWGLGGEVEYALEGSVFNAGSVIQWLREELRLIDRASECDTLAESVLDTGGVYMVPAFTGLGAPYWDASARGLIIGLTRGTSRAHLARAALESIAYQTDAFMDAMEQDAAIAAAELRADGGASVSDVLMQFQADISGKTVVRPRVVQTTAWGAACLAGLAAGVWSDRASLASLWRTETVFKPRMGDAERAHLREGWRLAVGRAMGWTK